MMAPMPYYCIHCGNEEPQVYKTYYKGNLVKLLNCTNCGQLIDEFVEYDPLIIVMKLVLQNERAYRHILLNTAFTGFWKLGIIFLFCESYCYWCFLQGMKNDSNVDFYELELNFYRVLLRTILSTFIFQGAMFLSIFIRAVVFKTKLPPQFTCLTFWKGLCLCGYAEIFDLLALVWSYSHTTSSLLFVNGLIVLSNTKSYHVVTGTKLSTSFLMTLCSLFLQKALFITFDKYILPKMAVFR